jgi:uncharacterized protein (TIGR01244 family)
MLILTAAAHARSGKAMTHQPVTGEFSVSPQIAPDEVAAIAKDGFRSIICNRPDGEAPDQTPHAVIEAEAAKAGLAFRYIPVISGAMTQDDVDTMTEALKELPAPVFAYCRSGARCGVLFRAVQAQG